MNYIFLFLVSLHLFSFQQLFKESIQKGNFHDKSSFDPNIGKKALWIIVFSVIEVLLAKCTENAISNLNIEFLELSSLVSYRFVPLSLLTIVLTLTNMSLPYLNWIGLVYLLISDTYFCVMLDIFRKLNLVIMQEICLRKKG